jgi:Histidine kinase-, DNA gyrase B-, and HSP90-like ATPase
MGETRVDLVHLLEDLRDAYPGSVEETILTEIVANALDSGARSLELRTERSERTLIARDDGRGMTRRELTRYHDLGASAKRRGHGIGFAGVGIKLGLLACDEVVTETRRGRLHAATSWRLSGRSRAPWSWIEPPHILEDGDGTAVLLKLTNALSPLLDAGFLETMVLRNFQPLFEPEFIDILGDSYPHGFSISIDDRVVVGPIRPAPRDPIGVRIGRQRKPSGIGYLSRHDEALPEHERGLAISTLGKVILRGWDWLGLTPADADRIEGVLEVPALAESLTLNKGDFLRTGQRGALFLAYRKAIQEVVADRLEAWGAAPPPKRTHRTRPFERDIRRVLGELTEDYPLLATLVERTAGGQRRLPFGDASANGALGAPADDAEGARASADRGEAATGAGDSAEAGGNGTGGVGDADRSRSRGDADRAAHEEGGPERSDATSPARPTTARVRLPGRGGGRRLATLSLQIRFETLDDELALSRLIESTVWVNDAHPAYRRARAARSEAYHIALAVAVALAPLAVEPGEAQQFISAFLASWGAAADGK